MCCAIAVALAAGACGEFSSDDPIGSGGPDPDGGSNRPIESGAPDVEGPRDSGVGDAHDGRAPSCAGQVFATPLLVGTAQVSSALATTMWGPRVAGPNAYFSAVPNGGSDQQLFRATFAAGVDGKAPSLSNAIVLAPPSSSAVEWAPTVSADNMLLVFATGFPPPRNLSCSSGSGGSFGAATPIASLSTSADETDPWLVGKPIASALYFGREDGARAMQIWRSAISAGPAFASAVKVELVCPQFSCGTPVVPTGEAMLLYASWAGGGFVPNVQESALSVSAGVGTAGPAIGHPELGARYPSWISDDGCEVLLGGGSVSTISDIYYARRAAK